MPSPSSKIDARLKTQQKQLDSKPKSEGKIIKRYRCKHWLCGKISNLKNFDS